jgi:hypothetical protein
MPFFMSRADSGFLDCMDSQPQQIEVIPLVLDTDVVFNTLGDVFCESSLSEFAADIAYYGSKRSCEVYEFMGRRFGFAKTPIGVFAIYESLDGDGVYKVTFTTNKAKSITLCEGVSSEFAIDTMIKWYDAMCLCEGISKGSGGGSERSSGDASGDGGKLAGTVGKDIFPSFDTALKSGSGKDKKSRGSAKYRLTPRGGKEVKLNPIRGRILTTAGHGIMSIMKNSTESNF